MKKIFSRVQTGEEAANFPLKFMLSGSRGQKRLSSKRIN
jgi:hypothetical protein